MDSVGHPAAWLHLFVDFGSNISTGKHKHRQHNVISEYQTLVQTPNIFPLDIIRLLDTQSIILIPIDIIYSMYYYIIRL
jgi:hypothetical protein